MNTKDYNFYKGLTVPDKIVESNPMSCVNSYCNEVGCVECINYPSIMTSAIKLEYEINNNKDEELEREGV